MRKGWQIVLMVAVLTVATGVLSPAVAGEEPLARVSAGTAGVEWLAAGGYERLILTVSSPDGTVIRREFGAGETPSFSLFDAQGAPRPDGSYTWELQAVPKVPKWVKERVAAAREAGDDAALEALRKSGRLPQGKVQSGVFSVAGGSVVAQDVAEPPARSQTRKVTSNSGLTPTTEADQVIPDDLIVQGSLCVGFDCVNNESFGFDTIRLKENNTRIKFEDTSTGSFPTNDWQLTANDSASGGASKFSIEDITGAKVPFTITAGASTNSIFVDSTGRVGFRTSTPVLDLHVATSNTPAIRLEQNNSGGFTAQTWDIAGNEANFFVRDVTGGSRLPFRIRPGAPTSSVDISADGDVGVGTASPSTSLHVSRSSGTAKLLIQETNGTASLRNMFEMENNGGIQMLWDRTDAGANDWQLSNFNATFEISIPGSSPGQFSLQADGDLQIGGTQYLTGSSRDLKERFVPVNGVDILQRVVEMPLTEWSAKADPNQRHIGPVAEDWWATFRLGPDDKHVSPTDIGGVALAAIKGLHEVVSEKDAEIAQLEQTVDSLEQQNSELAARLAAIEQMLKAHGQ